MKYLAVLFFLFNSIFATTIYIPTDFPTIQDGINESTDGDTIIVNPGTYYENLVLNKEVVLKSSVDFESLGSDWYNNETIKNTIVNGLVENAHPKKNSCLIIRDGNIQPVIKGITFDGGQGTSMMINDQCADALQERSGGGILIYDAYPKINYNRFVNNGSSSVLGQRNLKKPKKGGAIAHYEDSDVEFDEDRQDIVASSNNSYRNPPASMDISNNYFDNNASGIGQEFYSHGYTGTIDISGSVFANIDCETNTVNNFSLYSMDDLASYNQTGITGECISTNEFFVSVNGSNSNMGTEDSPFQTIGHALSKVKNNGQATTINVASGIYSTALTGEIFPITIPNNVHLIGEDSESTILDASANQESESAVILIHEVETLTLKNFTLRNGYTEAHGCTGGGALLVAANDMYNPDNGNFGAEQGEISTPLIENLIIEDSHSYTGGGLSFFRVNGPIVNNLIIRNNTSSLHGGGIFIYVSDVTLNDLTIYGNETLGTEVDDISHGGGIMINQGGGTYNNLHIYDNTAIAMGGALWCSYGGWWSLNNSLIENNNASWNGGGIAFYDNNTTDGVPEINNCTISNNNANGSGWFGYGGGYWSFNSDVIIDSSVFSSNSANNNGGATNLWGGSSMNISNSIIQDNVITSGDGGGIYLADDAGTQSIIERCVVINNVGSNGGGISLGVSADVINTTIYNNSTGGGVGIRNGATCSIVNSIIYNNSPSPIVGTTSNLSVVYSNIESGWAGTGNISEDPLFVSASTNDFSLQTESPCIDAGTADIDQNGVDDVTVFEGEAPDIGAVESPIVLYPPQNFTVNLLEQQASVFILWSSDGISNGYKVEKSLSDDFLSDVEEFYVTMTSFFDDSLEQGVEYYYRIFSMYNDVSSEPSDVITVMLQTMSAENSTTTVPEVFRLHQNHPNPFNPNTILNYDIAKDEFVRISIYDLKGREVKTLVEEYQLAGRRSVHWNATDNYDRPIPAGMYVYTIHAGNFMQTKKMILLK